MRKLLSFLAISSACALTLIGITSQSFSAATTEVTNTSTDFSTRERTSFKDDWPSKSPNFQSEPTKLKEVCRGIHHSALDEYKSAISEYFEPANLTPGARLKFHLDANESGSAQKLVGNSGTAADRFYCEQAIFEAGLDPSTRRVACDCEFTSKAKEGSSHFTCKDLG